MLLRSTSTFRFSSIGRPRIPVAGGRQALVAAAFALLALAVAACGGGPGGTVDNTNPCVTDDMFVELPARSAALEKAESLDAVEWTSAPEIKDGTLTATGRLTIDDAQLFDPLREDDRDSPAFSVYYVGHTEALAELVPDLPDDKCWKTTDWQMTVTIASTEIGTTEGADDRGFTIEASSPLFRDVFGSELELRVWGTDAGGTEALLSKESIVTE